MFTFLGNFKCIIFNSYSSIYFFSCHKKKIHTLSERIKGFLLQIFSDTPSKGGL